MCSEPSQTDSHKQAATVNALSGHDWVLTLPILWKVLFGFVASVKMPCCVFCSNQLLFVICKEATARPGYKPFIDPINKVYD